jgi:hypothetical protein
MSDADVEEVHQIMSTVEEPAVLSLSDLETCSRAAVSELRYWIVKGFKIARATPFIRMLLDSETE